MIQSTRTATALIAVGVGVATILFAAPFAGWPVVRLPAVILPALFIVAIIFRPWRWDDRRLRAIDAWTPPARVVWSAALVTGLALFWFVLTRFQSGEINGVDFTVYFDRPLFQTLQGRLLFVESADDVLRAQKTLLIIHAYWALVPLALLYGIHATPLWLLALSVAAVVAGSVHVFRILQRLGAGSLLAGASALAFVLNDNTARTLNYGFHPEVLYAWFIPWLLDAGLAGRRMSYLAAAAACVLVKEDACLLLLASAVALGLHRYHELTWADRLFFLAAPTLAALVNLAMYYGAIVPALTGGSVLIYGNYWVGYGATPLQAALGMARQPVRVLSSALTSGFFTRVILPHLFLPLVGWRWTLGIAPIVALYGASSNDQLRGYGIYYAVVLIPFLVIGASIGALAIVDRLPIAAARRRPLAALIVLAGALLVGSTSAGYSLRPWRAEVGSVRDLVEQFDGEPVVLVQSGLYPHTGYDERIQLLTPDAVTDAGNAGAVVVLAPAIGAYPFSRADIDALAALPALRPPADGLLAVRLTALPARYQ
ncbi:MAG TPA: DUF2079 domain-containing protein [Vicinamibacterales bacterium]|nr:DUF2079 domain-containing protein [Vicinamibacterales bacterium]